jgi:hypothetical protein
MSLKGILKRHPEKLSAAICLNPLDRKWKFCDQAMLKKMDRMAGGTSGVEAKHAQAGAIINSGILKAPRVYLHRIHLNPISR